MLRSNLVQGVHWILPAIGFGVYGFTFGSISATALSYLMDCHQEVSCLIHEAIFADSGIRSSETP